MLFRSRIAIIPLNSEILARLSPEECKDLLWETLSAALWRRDVFDDSEPVAMPSEFFGREVVVQEVVSKAILGKPTAIFGLRKIGKSSLLRRVQGLLDADPYVLVVSAFVLCNATRIKASHWYVLLNDLLGQWVACIRRRSEQCGLEIDPKVGRLAKLIGSGANVPEPGDVAEAFQQIGRAHV